MAFESILLPTVGYSQCSRSEARRPGWCLSRRRRAQSVRPKSHIDFHLAGRPSQLQVARHDLTNPSLAAGLANLRPDRMNLVDRATRADAQYLSCGWAMNGSLGARWRQPCPARRGHTAQALAWRRRVEGTEDSILSALSYARAEENGFAHSITTPSSPS